MTSDKYGGKSDICGFKKVWCGFDLNKSCLFVFLKRETTINLTLVPFYFLGKNTNTVVNLPIGFPKKKRNIFLKFPLQVQGSKLNFFLGSTGAPDFINVGVLDKILSHP